MPASRDVLMKSEEAQDALGRALDWVQNLPDELASSNKRLVRGLRADSYRIKLIRSNSSARPCAAVYGPSQAGKSYLVSALARLPDSPLLIKVGGRDVDFIELVNPEGGKESTGLVTRFTTSQHVIDNVYPVKLRLLSEIDLVKIFVNSYCLDVADDEEEAIERHLDSVQQAITGLGDMPSGPSLVSSEQVYELEDYVAYRFKSNNRIQAILRTNFWSEAALRLPTLDRNERTQIYKILWDDIPAFSSLFGNLLADLEALQYSSTIFASPEILFEVDGSRWNRSPSSVVNVESLGHYGNSTRKRVAIKTESGEVFTVSVAAVAALAAELELVCSKNGSSIFEHSDLLDFPGARSRKPRSRSFFNASADSDVDREFFLRGKVSFLFDKYCESQEISSLVLCIGPSNQEVVGLDSIIEDWIISTHGQSSQDRLLSRIALFFVLTKFDQEFGEGGLNLDGGRWTTRLQASLIFPFGNRAGRTNWVNDWSQGAAFNNLFWLRNPSADQSGLIEYSGVPGKSRELRHSDRKSGVIEVLREAFLSNSLVQKHFSNPSAAWSAGMALNDGGASYLIDKLRDGYSSTLRSDQTITRLRNIVRPYRERLQKYYVPTDEEDVRKHQLELARKISTFFLGLYQERKLTEFVRLLYAPHSVVLDSLRRSITDYEQIAGASTSGIKSDTVKLDSELLAKLNLLDDDSTIDGSQVTSQVRPSFQEFFVARLFEELLDRHRNQLSSPGLMTYFKAERDLCSRFFDQIESMAWRTGIVRQMCEHISVASQYQGDDRRGWLLRQAVVVAALYNHFIDAGFRPVKSERSTSRVGMNVDVSPVGLDQMRPSFWEDQQKDWLVATNQAISENCGGNVPMNLDLERNKALGGILDNIDAILRVD